jgi:hypothetical protein
MEVTISGKLEEDSRFGGFLVTAYLNPAEANRLNIDRTQVAAWNFPEDERGLAERLVNAVQAQKALTPANVQNDVDGNAYLKVTHNVWAKRLPSDLKRLGF